MKILVPHKHNDIMIQDLKRGECFWSNNRLYMKVEIHGGPYDNDKCRILDLAQGVIFILNNDVLVTQDNNICITELQSEEKMNREISIENSARKLCKKLNEINESEEYKSVWEYLSVHGIKYDGPVYAKELKNLESVLGE